MIAFYSADVPIPVRDRAKVKHWLRHVGKEWGFGFGSLSYIFCSDEYLLQMNKDYLQHDYYTDIITFPLDDSSEEVNGECYISVDRVRDNAKENGVTFAAELRRVMVHGLLHLMGQNDKSEEESAQMRIAEDSSLRLWAFHVERLSK